MSQRKPARRWLRLVTEWMAAHQSEVELRMRKVFVRGPDSWRA